MDKAMLQATLACLLWVFQIPTSVALSSDTEKAVRAATFEFRAPASEVHSKDLVGSAFAIGANEFVSAAHLFDRAIGSHFGHPVLMDLSHGEYRVADILQFSEQQDYVVFSLERPPRVTPLAIRQSEHTEPDLYFAGWRSDGRIVIEHGTFCGVTHDKEPGQADWLRFSGPLWGGIGGGPLLDSSGRVVGIVQARARNGDANYAVPVGVLPLEGPGRAHIHAMEMLRSLMPVVSSVTPLEADIPLPISFDRFSHELGQLRLEYFEREIGPLLDATRRNFVLRGDGAADVCNLLNGKSCECRPRAGVSGVLVVDDAGANELVRQVGTERDVLQKIAGAVLLRIPEDGARARRRDLSSDPLLHLKLALKGQGGPDPSLEESVKTASRPATDEDRVYVDFHDRTWLMRTWPLLSQDLELVSLARKLPDGYVVLTRTVPAALGYAAELQLKVLANLVYYACDELPGEGVAVLADTMQR